MMQFFAHGQDHLVLNDLSAHTAIALGQDIVSVIGTPQISVDTNVLA